MPALLHPVLMVRPTGLPRGGRVLARSGLGSVRSSAFLSVFAVVYQGTSFVSRNANATCPSEDADFVPYAALLSCFYLPKTIVYVVAWAVEVLANVGRASGVRDGRQRKASRASPATLRLPPAVFLLITVRASDHTNLAPHTARWVLAKQPAHRSRGTVGPASPQVACSSLSKAAITLLLNRRTITHFGRLELSLALEGHAEAAEWEEAKDPAHRLPRWALALGADSDVRPPRPPATRYPTPTLFRTRRILQHIFYFFIVCPPMPTLDEHFGIDVQAPTGVSPISPCATQGDFFKVKPNSSLEAPSPNPRHLGESSRMDIQALAPVPPTSPWRCHGEFRSLRTLDHPSPPLPRDPSWTFGCWPPCRPFNAYAPKPKFVFSSNPVHPTPPFPTIPGWTFRRWPPPCQIDLDRVTAILARPPFTHGTSSQDLHPPTPHFPSVSGRTFERWQPISPLRSEADFFL
ncbi:hypothetical protein B0H14DRAFT_3438950 [Mycena olivaceomarginata]|nr:hypothetical protein B0H14DRAFT_3438950 [Mycena olivaceomarginata]